MAIGLPVKANYAAGDILTATNMNDLSGTFNNVATSYGNAAGKNKIINGSMAVAQRGTTFSGGNAYTLDRWYVDSATTIARDTGTAGIPYSIKISNSAGNPAIRQAIELPAANNAGAFAVGTTWTVSYYAKRSTGTANAAIYMPFSNGMGADGSQIYANANIGTITTSWQRFSATFTISATTAATDTAVKVVAYAASGSFAGDTWFTGVQLEAGSIATPFQTASGGSIQSELAMCQRYYFRMGGEQTNSDYGIGLGNSGGLVEVPIVLPTKMRVPPTSVDFASCRVYDGTSVIAVSSLILTGTGGGSNNQRVSLTLASGSTSFRPYIFGANGTTASFLGFSAEL